MSYFAGVVEFGAAASLEQALEPWLTESLRSEEAVTRNVPGAAVAYVDLGAFHEHALVADNLKLAVVAGHPLLGNDTASESRDGRRGVSALQDEDDAILAARLSDAHGVFALAAFDSTSQTLTLASDRLGVRPIYWWSDGLRAVFSSRLSDVVEHPWVPVALDERGLVETLSLGFALDRRTPYVGVSRIGPAEVVRLSRAGVRTIDWSTAVDPDRHTSDPTPELMVERLRAAVARRARPGRQATFLSGGLDSRVVSALVAERESRIFSFNFSPPGSQDEVYAERFADVLGAAHVSGGQPPRPHWSQLMADALAEVPELATHTQPVWSGDGGSVCLGWVYVTNEVVAAAERGDFPKLASLHLRDHSGRIPERDLLPEVYSRYQAGLEGGIVELLNGYPDSDPVDRFFRFLVENDQRRHLDRHFETLLQHRTEFWLPFFDAGVLEIALRTPPARGRSHRFYSEWFELLGKDVRSTPWQTYPGHVPCPIAEEGLSYQWAQVTRRDFDRGLGRDVLRLLLSGNLPGDVVRRRVVATRAILHAGGFRDSGGLLSWLRSFGDYSNKAKSR